jgi:phosphatidylglycerol lysyltransferase
VVVGYHVLTIVVRAPLRVRRWQLRLRSLKLAVLQTLVSLLDWSLAAFALYVLLPAELSIGFFLLLGTFALAILGGLISRVPGGIGVFERRDIGNPACGAAPSAARAPVIIAAR